MRILFSFVGGRGHFEPLAPIARAAADAGHDVAFGCAPAAGAIPHEAGFAHFTIGHDAPRSTERVPLRPVDRGREERDLRERFVRVAGRYRAPFVRALCEAWRPDVLVCDETDFGAQVAAEAMGLPLASVSVLIAGGFVRPDVVGAELDALRAEHGLPPDPGLAMPGRGLVLSIAPPSLRDPADPLPEMALAIRPPPRRAKGDAPPDWASARPGALVVYLTLGTVFPAESGDLLARAVTGLRALPINLLVTVGSEIAPEELGPQPAHVRIERYRPQASVLPYCDLIVSHAGSGSVVGALWHGLPSLLIPLGADQPWNAERCERLGVARVIDAVTATPESIGAATEALLGDGACRRSAGRLRDEMEALPDASHAVERLESLAAGGGPLG